ncbi:MAG: hypothetical protein KKD77_20575, partial [Gammaproteobacteria bacterium]|nr:hypothetical protein [Gammaproteobacteria bacterium]
MDIKEIEKHLVAYNETLPYIKSTTLGEFQSKMKRRTENLDAIVRALPDLLAEVERLQARNVELQRCLAALIYIDWEHAVQEAL